MNISIFYALPQEMGNLVRSLGAARTARYPCRAFEMHYRSARLVFLETGVGGRAAKRAFDHHLAEGTPDVVISAGFGGALDYDAPIGQTILGTSFLLFSGSRMVNSLETPLLPRLYRTPDRVRQGTVVTLEQPVEKRTVREKISSDFALPVCDMESYYLAERAIARGISFFAIRSVSDTGRTEVPSAFFEVCNGDVSGEYSTTKVFAMLVRNPHLIPKAMLLGFHSRTAARHLGRAIRALVDMLL